MIENLGIYSRSTWPLWLASPFGEEPLTLMKIPKAEGGAGDAGDL